MDFADLTVETAGGHVGDPFSLDLNDGSTLELVLDEVTELPTGPGEATATSFSLTFRGPSEPALSQGTYGLSHKRAEPQPVFLVPVANSADSTVYEAVFTRL